MTFPLAALAACGDGFSAQNAGSEADSSTDDAGGDGSDDGTVIVINHDAGGDVHDASVVDAKGDAQNDGPSDGSASDGFTGCPTGDLTCNGQCVPIGPNNCGGCNVACDAGAPVCQASGSTYSCATGCSGSTPTLCSGTCVNTTNNPSNCGGCGHSCPAVANAQPACANSACSFTCSNGYQQCGSGCITITPDTAHGVFVAQGGGTSSSCGTEILPCGTIAAALAIVSQSLGAKSILYLDDKSTFTEVVSLPAGVTLQGGWVDNAGTWNHECSPTTIATIQAPATSNKTVTASYTGSSTIDTVVIKSKAAANAGESLYGVFATGSSTALKLQNVTIGVAAGGAGTDMPTAAAGQAGSTAGCTSASTGAAGGAGSTGSAGGSAYGATGFSTTTGTAGGTGQPGQNGTAGGSGACMTGFSSCDFDSSINACDQGGGSPATLICGTNGLSGCGGQGGLGGQPGTGGGASLGVLAYQAAVTISGGSIATGTGGKGGNGGLGGGDGSGEPGLAGQNACYSVMCTNITTCAFTCKASVNGGTSGGNGGNGGSGGQGGGGTGGDSYCAASGGGGNVTTAGWTCTPGAKGAGGSPNGAAGNTGNLKSF